jgi:DNA-binding response OmpR family regulator
MHILIVEDDHTLNNNIREAITSDGFSSAEAYDGLIADKILRKEQFDCVIMDINLPGKNGYDLCRDFRSYNAQTPVLMLTAFSELEDKVKGFDSGADDYLTKPFYMRELLLRLHSLTRRNKSQTGNNTDDEQTVAGDIVIHKSRKRVYRQGQEISLTPREYQILQRLSESAGEVVSKKELVREIWGQTFDANTNTIEVYINFLRNKLDKPFGKNTIRTRVGYGYYLETD